MADPNPHFVLREDLANSGRTRFVVPLLGPRSQSQIGIPGRSGGFDRFLVRLLAVRQNGWITDRHKSATSSWRASGGGGDGSIALASNTVRRGFEVLGFDCL
jgi:hypothetical protein